MAQNIQFTSEKNYLKASTSDTQVIPMNKPNTFESSAFIYSSTLPVSHNLGYIPLIRAWYSPSNNTYRYPTVGFYDGNGTLSDLCLNGIVPFDCGVYDITTTTVTFKAISSSSFSGTFNLYYKIYLDPTT